jgi:chorismate mutase
MNDLDSSRKKIDEVDARLVELLAERFSLVEEVKSIKQSSNHAFRDEDRWQEIIVRLDELAEKNGLEPKGVQAVFEQIHNYALNYIYEV